MRRTLFVLIAVASVGTLTAGCGSDEKLITEVTLPTYPPASAEPPVVIDQTVNGGTVVLPVGRRLHVRLPQSPDSTDQWAVVNFESGILITDGGPLADGNATIWQYRTVQPGNTALQYSYTPANKPPVLPAPAFHLDVRVT
ncbi:protease inhibitor I42 family protein [Nocardia sp. SSK8]|uniref:protease inhibitor I42 family protein n=1 Tax=Nocardia sp. SSK8 TaxID=3120154 RepID=UPI00300A5E22